MDFRVMGLGVISLIILIFIMLYGLKLMREQRSAITQKEEQQDGA